MRDSRDESGQEGIGLMLLCDRFLVLHHLQVTHLAKSHIEFESLDARFNLGLSIGYLQVHGNQFVN